MRFAEKAADLPHELIPVRRTVVVVAVVRDEGGVPGGFRESFAVREWDCAVAAAVEDDNGAIQGLECPEIIEWIADEKSRHEIPLGHFRDADKCGLQNHRC